MLCTLFREGEQVVKTNIKYNITSCKKTSLSCVGMKSRPNERRNEKITTPYGALAEHHATAICR